MTELTVDLLERIAVNVLEGDHRKVAARREGVRNAEYGRWEKRGSDVLDEDLEVEEDSQDDYCSRLVNAIELAEALCEAHWVEQWKMMKQKALETGKATPWQACCTFLERRFPQRWSRMEKPQAEKQSAEDFFKEVERAEQKEKKS